MINLLSLFPVRTFMDALWAHKVSKGKTSRYNDQEITKDQHQYLCNVQFHRYLKPTGHFYKGFGF